MLRRLFSHAVVLVAGDLLSATSGVQMPLDDHLQKGASLLLGLGRREKCLAFHGLLHGYAIVQFGLEDTAAHASISLNQPQSQVDAAGTRCSYCSDSWLPHQGACGHSFPSQYNS